MCITRQKKNLEQDRVPRFPFTCTKVLGKHLYLMEKQSDKDKALKIKQLKQFRIENRNENAEIQRNIEILVEKFLLSKIENGSIRNSIDAENQKKQIKEIVMNKLQESQKHGLGRKYIQLMPFSELEASTPISIKKSSDVGKNIANQLLMHRRLSISSVRPIILQDETPKSSTPINQPQIVLEQIESDDE